MANGLDSGASNAAVTGYATRHAVLVAFLVLLAGFAMLTVGALTGRYFFVSKSVVLPLLLLAATLSGQTRAFLRDWLLFLTLLFLFDTLRGSIYVTIFQLQLPWYLGYPIRLEELLFGVPSVSHWLHDTWPYLVSSVPFRNFMVLIHASHFLYFLGFGFAIYRLAPGHFERFRKAMVLVMAGGLIGYLLVPTVPPWMAASYFGVLPPIERLAGQIYNTYASALFAGMQTNHIAAMPSLHAAFPTVCCVFACRLLGWRAWPAVVYTILTLFSPIYLVEHYAVDVLAGIGLGAGAYLLAYWHAREAKPAVSTPTGPDGGWEGFVGFMGVSRLATCVLVFYVALGFGYFNRGSVFPELLPNAAFIERELAGRTELEAFFEGALALQEGDQDSARRLLGDGLKHPVASQDGFDGYVLLLPAAVRGDTLPLLIDLLEGMPNDLTTSMSRMVLEEAYRLADASANPAFNVG